MRSIRRAMNRPRASDAAATGFGGAMPAVVLAFMLAVVVVLSACGSGSDGDDRGAAASAAAATSAPTAQDALESERRIEELTAGCMQEQGFEYQLDAAAVAARIGEVSGLAGREFAAAYGFGVSTNVGDGGDGAAVVQSTGEDVAGTDANADYVSSLGADGADAWNLALYGDPESGETGCYDAAIAEVFGAQTQSTAELDALAEATERAQADPDMVELQRTWSACMAEAGHDYAKPIDAYLDIEGRFGALGDPSTAGDELAQLQELERTVALAAFDCNAGIERTYNEIVARYLPND